MPNTKIVTKVEGEIELSENDVDFLACLFATVLNGREKAGRKTA